MSALFVFNSLAYAALMRANEPETVIIVLILTVCSSHVFTCANITYHGSSAVPGSTIDGLYIQWGRD